MKEQPVEKELFLQLCYLVSTVGGSVSLGLWYTGGGFIRNAGRGGWGGGEEQEQGRRKGWKGTRIISLVKICKKS